MFKRDKTITNYCHKNNRRIIFLLEHNGIIDRFKREVLPIIPSDKSKQFIEDGNKNRLNESMLA